MKIKERHRLRKPSGPYLVGFTQFTMPYAPAGKNGGERIIPCLCFYPAQNAGQGILKRYVSEKILPAAGGIKTNSYTDAPVCPGRHPLLLFSHGYGLFCEANTVQCEEMASHGYIVLSIGHQGEGTYELPDGEILTADEEMTGDFLAGEAEYNRIFPAYAAWLRGSGKDAGIDEHLDYYKKIIDNVPGMTAHLELWIKDSLAALDMLLHGNGPEKAIPGTYVDKEKIGAFGMSFGGAAALGLAHECELIKAAADLDGFFLSSRWRNPVQKPILLMHNDSALRGRHLTFPFLNAGDDAYMITVKNSAHWNFADYNEILAENHTVRVMTGDEEVETALLGEINPDRMESLINSLLLDFFNKYLRGMDSQVLDTGNSPVEAVLARKTSK